MGNSCNSQTQLSTARLLTDAVDISGCRKKRRRGRQQRSYSKESSQEDSTLTQDVYDIRTTNEFGYDHQNDYGIDADSSNNKTTNVKHEVVCMNTNDDETKSSLTNSQKLDKLKGKCKRGRKLILIIVDVVVYEDC